MHSNSVAMLNNKLDNYYNNIITMKDAYNNNDNNNDNNNNNDNGFNIRCLCLCLSYVS